MGDVTFTLDVKGFQRALALKGNALFTTTRSSLERSRLRLDKHMQTNRLRGRPGLFRRSGRLAQSFTGETTGASLRELVMRYGTNVAYARIHEEGGTIRPRRAKWLTIPLPANLMPSGVMRRSIRSFKHVRFIRNKRTGHAGPSLTALCGDSPESMKPMFVLVKEVKIPPRLGLMKSWADERNRLIADLNRAVREALA